MKEESGTAGCARIIVIIGLIASLMTIFTFVTGILGLPQIIQGSRSLPSPDATSPPVITEVYPTSTSETLPTSTPVPVETPLIVNVQPQLIESGEGYRIEQICTGETGAELLIQAPDFPYQDLDSWFIYSVVRDITGNWQQEFPSGASDESFSFSAQGLAEADVPVGDWVVKQDSASYTAHIYGYWGNTFVGDYVGFVFPVRDRCISKATLMAGKLEIGVLDQGGTNVIVHAVVEVLCQTTDLAGNAVTDIKCPGEEYGVFGFTNATGIASFYLGPGNYYIKYSSGEGLAEYKYMYGIHLSAGEVQRAIVYYP